MSTPHGNTVFTKGKPTPSIIMTVTDQGIDVNYNDGHAQSECSNPRLLQSGCNQTTNIDPRRRPKGALIAYS